MGIRKFNITISDIQSGAKFPADCTDRADVAAADPRNDTLLYTFFLIFSYLYVNVNKSVHKYIKQKNKFWQCLPALQ